MSFVRAVAFLWGLFACSIITYFGVQWMTETPANPVRNELLDGVAMGLLYGSPAWFALPLLAWFGRRTYGKRIQIVLLSPLFFATVLVALLAAKVGA